MEIDLSGRTAFISGSTQGIGRAIAAGLASAGADVWINGRDEDKVARVSAELGASGVAHYGVTETALLGVARGFAKAMKGTGVTVTR